MRNVRLGEGVKCGAKLSKETGGGRAAWGLGYSCRNLAGILRFPRRGRHCARESDASSLLTTISLLPDSGLKRPRGQKQWLRIWFITCNPSKRVTLSSLETTLFFVSVELLRGLDYNGHSFLLQATISRVVAESVQMIEFTTTTDTRLTEMWCLQVIGEIVHKAEAKGSVEADGSRWKFMQDDLVRRDFLWADRWTMIEI